ncbi:MAG: hypothetical protein AUI33_08500, partial [Ignavibacteria bacterium 13_1_40CM_2_61_4]
MEILIVEDSPTQAKQLQYILEQHGYSLSTARNGREALASIGQRLPTLVISDVIMPEMDGYELCRQIKQTEKLKGLPVILLTSLIDPADVVRGLEAGADSFIFKPYDEPYLLTQVASTLANWRLRETERTQMGVEIFFAGRKFFITSDRLQILNLLLSTYEAAVQKNRELALAQDELRHVNDRLEAKVRERTAALEAEVIEHRQAEEALRQSQQRSRAVVETAMDGLITMDHEGRIVDFNAAAEQIFGYRGSEVIGQPLADIIIPPPLREQHRRGLAHYLATGEAPVLGRRIEIVGQRADGSMIPVELTITQMPGAGAPMFTGFLRDITERKRAEQKLQAQLGRLDLLNRITRAIGERLDLQSIFQVVIRSLEDDLPIDFGCLCLYDPTDEVLTVTSVGVRSEGLALELALTRQARIALAQSGLAGCVRGQVVYEPDLSQVQLPFLQQLARGGLHSLVAAPLLVESKVFGVLMTARRQPHSFSSGECEFVQQLSGHVALAAHQAQLHASLQQAYDDLRQTQQAVLQQERLRALGQMASGIAHDINNAISPLALYTESLLENEPNLSPNARSHLETMQNAIEDVAHTVSRLREFYRQREPQLMLLPVDLTQVLQQAVDLTRARWSDMPQQRGLVIDVHMDLAPDLPAIMGVESELREALLNLVFNAVDAMPEGGNLTLRTRAVSAEPRGGKGEALTHVQVEICDTGMGMDEDTRRQCLEPFFTTKGEHGTGLGLAMVYGIVQRHSAELEIDSTVGQGTTVRLIFAVPLDVARKPALPAAHGQVPTQLRLLIVDDDPLLLKSLCDALEGDGHLVSAADSGQSGIDLFRAAAQRGESFAAVITDLGMPYMDGRRVAAAIKAAAPTTPVIL